MRRVSKVGLDLIKSFEGLSLKAYLCPANVPTIGYGTTVYPNGKKVSMKDPDITEIQATEYLQHEVDKKALEVLNMVNVSINDNEFAALVSFAYNVGTNALKSSTLLRLLNSNADKNAVADQFLRWNKAGGKVLSGLSRRREAERSLFMQAEDDLLPEGPSKEEIEDKLKSIEDDIIKK